MVSKEELRVRIYALETRMETKTQRIDKLRDDIYRLERLVEDLAEKAGYNIVYKKGLYLEPIEEDIDE